MEVRRTTFILNDSLVTNFESDILYFLFSINCIAFWSIKLLLEITKRFLIIVIWAFGLRITHHQPELILSISRTTSLVNEPNPVKSSYLVECVRRCCDCWSTPVSWSLSPPLCTAEEPIRLLPRQRAALQLPVVHRPSHRTGQALTLEG